MSHELMRGKHGQIKWNEDLYVAHQMKHPLSLCDGRLVMSSHHLFRVYIRNNGVIEEHSLITHQCISICCVCDPYSLLRSVIPSWYRK
jgi:hypothetical protein